MALVHNTNIVRSGLILHLDAANSKSYPGSGSTWYDLSGRGNNGTLTNGAVFSNSTIKSFVFDGTDDYLSFANISSNTSGFTWDFWININTVQPNNTNFWCYFYGLNSATIEIGVYNGASGPTSFTMVNYDNAPTRPSVSVSSSLGNWVNIVLGCDNQIPFMQLNSGRLVTSSAFQSLSLPIIDLFRSQGYGGRNLKGNLSSFKVYNRALTAAEITQNFEATRDRYGV